MDAPGSLSEHASARAAIQASITRRRALAAGAAFVGATAAAPMARAVSEASSDPFHDPSYSFIRSRRELVAGLSKAALQAQDGPRSIKGIAVTGLPEIIPELDDKITELMAA